MMLSLVIAILLATLSLLGCGRARTPYGYEVLTGVQVDDPNFSFGEIGIFDDFTAGMNGLFVAGIGAGTGAVVGAIVGAATK